MKRVLFYCQHLLGIGHVTRSHALLRALRESFEVTYVQGGPAIPKAPPPGVRLVQLPPLLMRESDSSLYDPAEKDTVEQVFAARATCLAALAAEETFDALVVELYPFGRNKFGPEVLRLMEALRARNPALKVVCSVRDILVAKKDAAARARKNVATIRAHFDQVWVHSDPNLLRFEQTFPLAHEIADRIRYTGFVAEGSVLPKVTRGNRILLSLGGGSVGEELYRAAAAVVGHFPGYEFEFVFGPYTSPALREELTAGLAAHGDRVRFSPLLKDFEAALARSALSLSMGGYNTVMNLLHTRTPALVLPYDANHEQRLRAHLLAERGYFTLLEDDDLRPERLRARMEEALHRAYPPHSPDLGGAARSRALLEELLTG